MQLIAFDVGDDFVVEADLVQVAAAVIQLVDLSAVGQDGGGAVAVEVVVVADSFGNRQVQHVILRIAPVGFGQAVLSVLFFARHLPLVPGDELVIFVVVEGDDALAVGGADEVTVQVVFVGAFGLDCYGINISDDLKKGSRSSEKQKPRAYGNNLHIQATTCCCVNNSTISSILVMWFVIKNI